jgi:hypothetical protein
MISTEKKKRGRKPKSDNIVKSENISDNIENQIIEENNDVTKDLEKVPKKRGRKPKGGKIIENIKPSINSEELKPNIILHLKCNSKDLDENLKDDHLESFTFSDNKINDLGYNFLKEKKENIINDSCSENNMNIIDYNSDLDNEDNSENLQKDIYKKLKELSINLHTNNIPDKKSSCFWCTYDFDNPPIFIPKHEINGSYHCYGCFCSLECACAFLMEENIDQASKFERYALLNYIYGKLYNFEKNIKPAPNPYYTLDKFYGNLSIQEYRKLLKTERLLLIVDKPLSRQLPELHEDNDDFLINNKVGINISRYKIKKGQNNQTKNSIMQDQFNKNI